MPTVLSLAWVSCRIRVGCPGRGSCWKMVLSWTSFCGRATRTFMRLGMWQIFTAHYSKAHACRA